MNPVKQLDEIADLMIKVCDIVCANIHLSESSDFGISVEDAISKNKGLLDYYSNIITNRLSNIVVKDIQPTTSETFNEIKSLIAQIQKISNFMGELSKTHPDQATDLIKIKEYADNLLANLQTHLQNAKNNGVSKSSDNILPLRNIA